MRRLSHTAPETVGDAIDRCARTLGRARVHFGHGTDNARDEAAELVFFAAGIAHSRGRAAYGKALTPRQRARIDELLRRRIAERMPACLPDASGVLRGPRAVRGRARAGAALADCGTRAASALRPGHRATARAAHSGSRHRLRRDRTGMCARPFRARGWMRVDMSAAALRCAGATCGGLGLGRRVRVLRIRLFRRGARLPLRYHREQPALCRARGNACAAARVPPRAATGAGRR